MLKILVDTLIKMLLLRAYFNFFHNFRVLPSRKNASKLYFHGIKVKTTLVFIFKKITFWKLSKVAYTGCLRRVEVHPILKKSKFGPFSD